MSRDKARRHQVKMKTGGFELFSSLGLSDSVSSGKHPKIRI
jgi:hypothetical protein